MLLPLRFAIILTVSCLIGATGARWASRERTAALPLGALPASSAGLQSEANAKDEPPGAGEERINAVFALTGKYNDLTKDHAIYAALLKLTAADFLAAARDVPAFLARLNSLARYERGDLIGAWFHRWLEIDSAGALDLLAVSPLLAQLPDGETQRIDLGAGNSMQCAALRVLARQHPEWTKTYLLGQPKERRRELGVYTLLLGTAHHNPSEARQFLALFSNEGNRSAAIQGYVRGASEGGDQAGFETALAEPEGPFREALLDTAIALMGSQGVETVRTLLDRIEDPALRRRQFANALDGQSFKDGEALLLLVKEELARPVSLNGPDSGRLPYTIARALNASNVAAAPAAEWAVSLENDPTREIFRRIAHGWAVKNPAELCAWLSKNASTLDAPAAGALSEALKAIGQGELAGARAWVDALPAGPIQEQARFQMALSAGTQGDFGQAKAIYQSMAVSDPAGVLAKELATLMAKKDGAQAAEWAMQWDAGPIRTELIKLVAGEWTERNPQAAALWLNQLPEGADRDAAISQYAGMASLSDPSTAAEWAQQVTNPALRDEAASKVFWTWSNEDPVAARAWIRELPGVTEAWRNKLLKKPGQL